eukprot:307901-Pleurochrysis_carterae.AAC.1
MRSSTQPCPNAPLPLKRTRARTKRTGRHGQSARGLRASSMHTAMQCQRRRPHRKGLQGAQLQARADA